MNVRHCINLLKDSGLDLNPNALAGITERLKSVKHYDALCWVFIILKDANLLTLEKVNTLINLSRHVKTLLFIIDLIRSRLEAVPADIYESLINTLGCIGFLEQSFKDVAPFLTLRLARDLIQQPENATTLSETIVYLSKEKILVWPNPIDYNAANFLTDEFVTYQLQVNKYFEIYQIVINNKPNLQSINWMLRNLSQVSLLRDNYSLVFNNGYFAGFLGLAMQDLNRNGRLTQSHVDMLFADPLKARVIAKEINRVVLPVNAINIKLNYFMMNCTGRAVTAPCVFPSINEHTARPYLI
jgi:hypothetical protein